MPIIIVPAWSVSVDDSIFEENHCSAIAPAMFHFVIINVIKGLLIC
jgi:hypothetical protein